MLLKRWIKAILLPGILLGGPAWWAPAIYFDWRFWTLVVLGVVLIGSQPDMAYGKMGAADKTKDDRYSIVLLHVGAYVQLFAAYGYYWCLAYRDLVPEISILSWIGAAGGVVGIIVRVVAIRTLGEWFTAVVVVQKDQELTTKGLYGCLRHPSYTGAILFWGCIPLLLNVWLVGLVTWPILAFVYYWRIRAEERALVRHFGSKYEDYQKRTWRIFPGV